MSIELYEHQKIAVNKLKTGSILRGGVGSGKSITSLYYYYVNKCGGEISKDIFIPMKNPIDLYIITTARKRDNLEWEKECSNFLLSKNKDNNPGNINVTIDSWNNISKYCNVQGSFFIFDEQKASGYGKWARSFIKIAKKNDWILLSATPGDKWENYIPVFIANGFYKNKNEFVSEHIIYSNFVKYPKVERYVNVKKLINLKRKIIVDMEFARNTVPNVENIIVDYDKELFKIIIKDRWNPYKNAPIKNVSELYSLMRKVSNSSIDHIEAARKKIKENIHLIIFYNFDYELEILRKLGEEEGRYISELNGHKHMDIPKNDRPWVYLVQYSSGSEAWNCISTNTILFYSLNYSYRITIQAMGRIDRLNTPYTNLYYYFITTKSFVDTGIQKSLSNKEDFNEDRNYKNSFNNWFAEKT